MADWSTVIGGTGVALLLTAFLLNVTGRLEISWTYTWINLIGAGLAAYASFLIGFAPFVALESVWFAVAAVKLVSLARERRTSEPPRDW